MKEPLFAQTSCIILAAGNSVRMGEHKALLKFDSQKTFIQNITETYLQSDIEQVIVVVNSELFKLISESSPELNRKASLIVNEHPERGRFYSLQTGLKQLQTGNSCFFQNIDNPFTSGELLKKLILYKDQADVIIPSYQGRAGHPVLISQSVAQEILLAEDSDLRIDVFLKKFKIKKVTTTERSISANINSREDYLEAGLNIY